MARTLQTDNLYTPTSLPTTVVNIGIRYCLTNWRKVFIVTLLSMFSIIFLIAFSLWAIGSYKVLSDDPTVWQSSIDFLNQKDAEIGLTKNKETLFVGSSSIRMFDNLEEFFPGYNILKKGFGGAKINDVSYFKEDIIFQYSPKLVVMYIGINDILYRDYQSIDELTSDLFTLTDEVIHRFTDSRLVLLAIRPLENEHYSQDISTFNQHLNTYASSHSRIHFVDANQDLQLANNKPNPDLLMWDGLHLNKQGYDAWGAQLHKKINALNIAQH